MPLALHSVFYITKLLAQVKKSQLYLATTLTAELRVWVIPPIITASRVIAESLHWPDLPTTIADTNSLDLPLLIGMNSKDHSVYPKEYQGTDEVRYNCAPEARTKPPDDNP